jgi:hypothetical protein
MENNIYGAQYLDPAPADFAGYLNPVGYSLDPSAVQLAAAYDPYLMGVNYDPYSAYYSSYLQQAYNAKMQAMKENYEAHLKAEQEKELEQI